MQRQVHGMITGRVVMAKLVIDPEREPGERACLINSPALRPSGWRGDCRIGEQCKIVKLERGAETSAKRGERRQQKKQLFPQMILCGLPKAVLKPKTSAERQARVKKILATLDKMYPGATCALHHSNAWELLVATILSAQCTDKRVNEVTPGLFRKYPTIQDFASVNQAELAQDIRSTGFFNNKSKSLIGAAKKILNDYGGEVPRTIEELLHVPGAARKTANVVLGTAFGIASGIVVDTHITRIARRLDLTKQSDPVKIEKDLMKIIPKEKWILFAHQIILHGRALCVARNPRCAECALDPICYAKDKERVVGSG
jgi:endonuclease-3